MFYNKVKMKQNLLQHYQKMHFIFKMNFKHSLSTQTPLPF